ncbi:MAG: hypothetical protein QF357_01255 [Dehalococcoidia bacterium]|jgi:hypothetical protein|nr:hypothetical protein [Dehalococcoidia bacterium]
MDDYLDDGGTFALVKRVSVAWLVLTAGALVLLSWALARDRRGRRHTRRWVWVLATALFGPFGLLAYRLSHPRRRNRASSWSRALGASVYSVTGNAVGLALVIAFYYLLLPNGESGPLVLVAPFLVAWLVLPPLRPHTRVAGT